MAHLRDWPDGRSRSYGYLRRTRKLKSEYCGRRLRFPLRGILHMG